MRQTIYFTFYTVDEGIIIPDSQALTQHTLLKKPAGTFAYLKKSARFDKI